MADEELMLMLDQLFQAITGTGTVIIIHVDAAYADADAAGPNFPGNHGNCNGHCQHTDADAVIFNLLILMLMVRGQLFQPMIETGTVLSTC